MRCSEGVESYQLKVSALEYFDLVHLGVGPDGHTASIFPDSPVDSFDPGVLVAENRDPHNKNPHERMTLTFAGIQKAKNVVFTIAGQSKIPVVKRLANGELMPATKVRAENITWLICRNALPDQAD